VAQCAAKRRHPSNLHLMPAIVQGLLATIHRHHHLGRPLRRPRQTALLRLPDRRLLLRLSHRAHHFAHPPHRLAGYGDAQLLRQVRCGLLERVVLPARQATRAKRGVSVEAPGPNWSSSGA
jgi:hypothetical protein